MISTHVSQRENQISLVHVDHNIVVVEKSAFLRSIDSKGGAQGTTTPNVLDITRELYPDAKLVHRLDFDTSGLMLLARTKSAQRHLNEQFQQRRIHKEYEAIVLGHLQQRSGRIELPIAKDWPNRPRQKIDFSTGKQAVTDYAVLEHLHSYPGDVKISRLRLFPVTGRSHQLRIHLRSLGHPIAGCDLYGNEAAYELSERLLLHATQLGFIHPESGKAISFVSPVPF